MKRYIYIFAALPVFVSCEVKNVEIDNPAVPATPVAVSVTVPEVNSLKFSWDSVASEYAYFLRNRAGKAVKAGKTGACSILFDGLAEGSRYYFAVKALSGVSQSQYCTPLEGVPGGIIIPEVPENIVVTEVDYEKISYSWSASPDAKKYLWYLRDADGLLVREGETDTTSFTVDNLDRGVTYLFSLRSWNGGKTSAESAGVGAMSLSDDDYLSLYLGGRSFPIDSIPVSRAEYPAHILRTPSSLTSSDLGKARSNVGIIFLDNGADSTNTFVCNSTKTLALGDSIILVGRYRRKPQPVIMATGSTAASFSLYGEILLKNIRIDVDGKYGMFIGKSSREKGVSHYHFDDCTLISRTNGIYRQQVSTAAVFHTVSVNNCIVRSAGSVISSSGGDKEAAVESVIFAACQNARSIIFRNCVFAPVSTAAKSLTGCLVRWHNPQHELNDLDIAAENCSFYNFVPYGGSSFVHLTNFHSLVLKNMIAGTTATLNKAVMAVTIYNDNKTTAPGGLWNLYFQLNNGYALVSTASRGKIEKTAGSGSFTVSCIVKPSTPVFGTADDSKDYFPSAVSGVGASYDTKYWIEK